MGSLTSGWEPKIYRMRLNDFLFVRVWCDISWYFGCFLISLFTSFTIQTDSTWTNGRGEKEKWEREIQSDWMSCSGSWRGLWLAAGLSLSMYHGSWLAKLSLKDRSTRPPLSLLPRSPRSIPSSWDESAHAAAAGPIMCSQRWFKRLAHPETHDRNILETR